MSNHLEDLTAEWLEFNGYFVRKSVLVGKRDEGGHEGELDVVAVHPHTKHLLHIECSLDADTWETRERRFTAKFERGRRYIASLFGGLDINADPDQVALLLSGGLRTHVGGGRIVWLAHFIADILAELSNRSPYKMAVPSTLPLIRTMQLAAQPTRKRKHAGSLLPTDAVMPRMASEAVLATGALE